VELIALGLQSAISGQGADRGQQVGPKIGEAAPFESGAAGLLPHQAIGRGQIVIGNRRPEVMSG